MKNLALIALCLLCMGASSRKFGVYIVTIKVDTTYVKTGVTENGIALYRQKIDTIEVWVDNALLADSILNIVDDWGSIAVPLNRWEILDSTTVHQW